MPQTSSSRQLIRNAPQSSSASAGIPTSVPDSALNLSREDVAALRQHQRLAHQNAHSSAASSAASSQGRLLLDPASLTLLGRHLERVMQAIQQRLELLNRATELATQTQYDRAGNVLEMADEAIARLRAIIQQIDDLETEFDKIRRIREIVRSFRGRVEQLEKRLG